MATKRGIRQHKPKTLKVSDHLDAVLAQYLPHPVRFRQVWNQQRGRRPFFAWQPVPPGEEFIALGMVGTTSEEPPPVDSMRCVHKSLCMRPIMAPQKIWDDSGSSGRQGSIWVVNSLGLLTVSRSHDLPPGPFYQLKSDSFFLVDCD